MPDDTPAPAEHLLQGVRVIEIGDEVSAYAGRLFAGLGADVIKVEPPHGCSTREIGPFYEDQPGPERSLFWWHYSLGKRSVVLDLERRFVIARGPDSSCWRRRMCCSTPRLAVSASGSAWTTRRSTAARRI